MECPLCSSAPVKPHFNIHLQMYCSLVFKIIEPRHPNMDCIEQRKLSFSGWPTQKISVKSLTEAGFYFTKVKDAVTCYWCGIIMKDWLNDDDALEKHLNEQPGCMFLWNTHFSERTGTMISLCKHCNLFTFNLSHTLRCTGLLEKDIQMRDIPGRLPRNPKMKTVARRLQTFNEWPLKEPFVKELVESGFFYSGMGDTVTCFYCDGDLNNWLQYDDPFEKHLDKYPRCHFALKAKRRAKWLKSKIVEVNYEVMKFELNRLGTFRSWPQRKFINAEHLAKIGFFCLGYEDYVQCAFCKVIVGDWDSECMQNWNTEDIPFKVHYMKTPNCPFLKGMNVKNIPMNRKILTPLHPDMMNEIKRLKSLNNWKNISVSKFNLAESGFYFIGNILKCFWCSFELNDVGENFLKTHAKNRPECIFAQSLLKEESRSENSENCKICMMTECDILFIPCNHFVSCETCASRIKNCCVCRSTISQKIKVFKG